MKDFAINNVTDKRICLFTGHFGSGKSEIAVNYTMRLRAAYERVSLLDFDVVNPFFRSSDAKEQLNAAGIRTILPEYANTNVDTPILTAEVYAAFDDKDMKAVFDVGGDDLGATAVATYRDKFLESGYEMFFVYNIFRPMTDTVDKMITMYNEVCGTAGLAATALINNTNILEETTGEIIYEGHQVMSELSDKLGVPVKITVGKMDALEEFVNIMERKGESQALDSIEFLPIDKMIRLPWQA